MIDHIYLRAQDYERTRAFYTAIVDVLEIEISGSGDGWMQVDELYIDAADPGSTPSHVHLAFQTKDRATVDAFYAAAVVAGGRDSGEPGERSYHRATTAPLSWTPTGDKRAGTKAARPNADAADTYWEAGAALGCSWAQ